jgi:hypothetical protein
MQIEEATRQGMIPLIGVYGKSGSGKTHSGLLLARGIAGPGRDIGIIDTERKRSGALVGLIPGGFKRINLEAPFTPESYSDAIKMFEAANIGCAVIDSLTHEWDGEGGVLEMQEEELQRMAGDNYSKREACKMAAWIKPKMRHKLLIAHILRCNIPLICCLRADEKTHIDKVDGKTKVSTDDFTTPIYDKRFIFEMLCNLETVNRDGKPGHARVTKWTHPDLLKCLPLDHEQISVKHGEAVARWCAASATTAAPSAQPATESQAVKALKGELWTLTRGIHGGDAIRLQQWLWDELCLDPSVRLSDLTNEAELKAVLALVRKKL